MNCCVKTPTSPRSMVAATNRFDIEFDYDFGTSRRSYVGTSEDERQEAKLMDALSIVESNKTMREAKQKHSGDDFNQKRSRSRENRIVVETVGVHTAESSVSKETVNTSETETCTSEQSSTRQCHGVETKTQHARINFFKSPSHMKEDVEMELKIPSNVLSHHTGSFHTGTEASSIGSLSTTSDDELNRAQDDKPHFSMAAFAHHETGRRDSTTTKEEERMLKETKEQLRITREQWKATQRELRESRQELTEIRDKAQIVKRELKNFNKEWESQQTLLRNKDKELERLRMIIADRTLQLTEKTGELSITKVALVASENGLSACKKQITSRSEELEKAKEDLKEAKKALADTKAELSRTKLQLEASAERRRKFSNKALRLLLGDSESMDMGKVPGHEDIANKESTADCQAASPKRPPLRAKSWSFTQSGSDDATDDAASMADCPVPYSFSGATQTRKKEIGVQTGPADGHSDREITITPDSRRDGPIVKPTRSRSFKDKKLDGTKQKSLDTAEESASSNDKLEDCSLTSLYFDSTSKALSMDVINTTTTKNTDTECNEGDFYFDSASKTPSASGGTRKSAFAERKRAHGVSTAASTTSSDFGTADSSAFDTAYEAVPPQTTPNHSRTNSLVESRSIEITASAVSHLTDPIVSEASFVTTSTSALTLLSARSRDEETSLLLKGKKWRALLKKMKENGADQEETESVTYSIGSCDDDVSFYSVIPHEKKAAVTGGLVAAIFIIFSIAFAFMANGLGISYRGGVLNLSDSGIIVSGTTIILFLALKSLWNLVEQAWTRLFAIWP